GDSFVRSHCDCGGIDSLPGHDFGFAAGAKHQGNGSRASTANLIWLQEGIAMLLIAKRFCAAGARGRERSGGVAEFQAVRKTGSENEFVQEAGVETVARADGVHRLNAGWSSMKAILAALGKRALRAAFDHHGGDEPG